MKFLHYIPSWLDRTGMYRVVSVSLLFLVVCSLALSVFGHSPYSFVEQMISLTAVVLVALVANVVLAKVFSVSANHESALITALILFFLFTPIYEFADVYFISGAALIAMVSKYVISWRKQHIFNAAAFGAVALSFTGLQEAWWWVAQPEMFIPLVIVGLMVLSKVRRFTMILSFLITGLIVVCVEGQMSGGGELTDTIYKFFVTGPALFLAFFMLTEPFTAPSTRNLQMYYGSFVGLLSSTILLSSYVAVTPELALLVGNLVFYPTTLRQKLFLKFKSKQEIASGTYEYEFEKPSGMKWLPGQYLEWMLPHKSDSRGPRRYFTIASAPEEETVKLALRVMDQNSSSYKQTLNDLKEGDSLIASQLAGDFCLPIYPDIKLAFVAGGIGVTPFRAFVGQMIEDGEDRDVALYYCNKFSKDIAYQDKFKEAKDKIGLRLINVLTDEEISGSEKGYLTKEIIERNTPDYLDRVWYISGPPGMVNAYKKLLREMRVPRSQIVTDFFPGLA